MYNKSEIMKEAWKEFKKYPRMSFAQCLSDSWRKAKIAIQDAIAYSITEFVDGMELTVGGITRVLKLWEKGGHRRVYINGGSRQGEGFVDLVRREAHVRERNSNARMAEIILNMNI